MSLLNSFSGRNISSDILSNGGGTYRVGVSSRVYIEDVNFQDGYMVALPGAEQVIPVAAFSDYAVGEYIGAHSRKFDDPNVYFGAWVDNGNVYLDCSEHFSNFLAADTAGILRSQLAIWDCAASEAIVVDGDRQAS